jgi:hypothetical protein
MKDEKKNARGAWPTGGRSGLAALRPDLVAGGVPVGVACVQSPREDAPEYFYCRGLLRIKSAYDEASQVLEPRCRA